MWSEVSTPKVDHERNQRRKENLDPKDQNSCQVFNAFLHKRLKKLGPVNTEGVKVQQRTSGPTMGGTELSLDQADEKQARSRSEVRWGRRRQRPGEAGDGRNTPASWLLGQWLKSQIS